MGESHGHRHWAFGLPTRRATFSECFRYAIGNEVPEELMAEPKWKRFEKLVHKMHTEFAPEGALVTLDDKIKGFESKVERQLDVTIRATLTLYKILIVVECKDEARPVDVGTLGEFASLLRDVKANKGVMFSTSGYTRAALDMAKAQGIDSLTYPSDMGRLEWKRVLGTHHSRILTPHDAEIMDLAVSKMKADFDQSALANTRMLNRCFDQAVANAEFFVQKINGRPLGNRVMRDTLDLNVPFPAPRPQEPNIDVMRFCRELLAERSLSINCEAIEVGALVTLRSMHDKYGLEMLVWDRDRSGKDVVKTLDKGHNFDFVVVPNAPFFALAESHGLAYRLIAPIHTEEQALLRKGQKLKHLPNVLAYSTSSAAEEWFNIRHNRTQYSLSGRRRYPWGPDVIEQLQQVERPIWVDSLNELVRETANLEEGDYVFAWYPLSAGLKQRHSSLQTIGSPFHNWLSLCAHGDHWCVGPAATALRRQFLYMFIYEWRNCAKSFDSWARPLIERDKGFLYYFSGGAGVYAD